MVKKGDAENSDVIEHLQLIFIELPKFPIHSSEEKKLRLLWLRFLREIDEKTTSVSKDLLDVPEIAQAVELAEESAYTPGELEIYQSYWDQVSREKTLMIGKFEEGLALGEARGKAETLIQIINRKFNKLLSKEDEIYVVSKTQQANVAQLTRWIDGVLDVVTLEDLFKMLGK